ncbi:MAG: XRE family transcriptional regulator [Brevinema sp.]
MGSIGERLKLVREELKMTQVVFAETLGVAQNNLGRYENNTSKLSSDKMINLHKINVNIDWLLTGEGEMFRGEGIEGSKMIVKEDQTLVPVQTNYPAAIEETVYVRKLEIEAAAGVGFINPDFETPVWVGLPESFIYPYNPRYVALLKATGSSMEPSIRSGDLLLVSEQNTNLESDFIYILRIGEELKVKRIVRKGNKNIVVWSDNESFGREEFTPQEWEEYGMQIVARVIKVIKDV